MPTQAYTTLLVDGKMAENYVTNVLGTMWEYKKKHINNTFESDEVTPSEISNDTRKKVRPLFL